MNARDPITGILTLLAGFGLRIARQADGSELTSRRVPGARTTRNQTRRSGSKSGSGRWSHWGEIAWVHSHEILQFGLAAGAAGAGLKR
jgi:hypothetical protein